MLWWICMLIIYFTFFGILILFSDIRMVPSDNYLWAISGNSIVTHFCYSISYLHAPINWPFRCRLCVTFDISLWNFYFHFLMHSEILNSSTTIFHYSVGNLDFLSPMYVYIRIILWNISRLKLTHKFSCGDKNPQI